MIWDNYIFLANNIHDIYGKSTLKKSKKSIIPKRVLFINKGVKYVIYEKGIICNNSLSELRFEYEHKTDVFDYKSYYALYHRYVEKKYGNLSLNMEQKTILYYIKYGYWFGLADVVLPEHYLRYKASYIHLHDKPIEIVKHDFNINKLPILFSEYSYLASNYEMLKKYNVWELTEHYISTGNKIGLKHDTFDYIKYLSEYPTAIDDILKRNYTIEYDYSLINLETVSMYYCNCKIKHKKINLDRYGFTKEFLKNKKVNFDMKLSIDNSHAYFVKGFVEDKYIREHITKVYKIKRFAKNRILDAMRQIPFGIVRYIIEFKLYV